MNKLCKKYPYIMRPLIFVLLFSGLGTVIIILALVFVYRNDFKDAHAEFYNYSVLGKIND